MAELEMEGKSATHVGRMDKLRNLKDRITLRLEKKLDAVDQGAVKRQKIGRLLEMRTRITERFVVTRKAEDELLLHVIDQSIQDLALC